ncbi:MAG: hypothetical protein MJ168_07685 [Clostridia bacterium]|nr:hypothetical protein [Clostridia bacterium]
MPITTADLHNTESFSKATENSATDFAISTSEADLKNNGILHDSKDVFDGLRKKYGE